MAGRHYYLVSALPALPDFGSPAPMTTADLRDHVRPSARPAALVDTILLSDDLVQREAFLAREIDAPAPAVLAAEQVRDEAPLPAALAAAEEAAAPLVESDAVWAAYFRHAAEVAGKFHSALLAGWVSYEVALRNALVTARAEVLELNPADYLVAAELGRTDEDFSDLLAAWSSAPNPLAGQKILDRARWMWLTEHEAWFSFADDEVAAYAAKLVLLVRWERLSAAPERSPSGTSHA